MTRKRKRVFTFLVSRYWVPLFVFDFFSRYLFEGQLADSCLVDFFTRLLAVPYLFLCFEPRQNGRGCLIIPCVLGRWGRNQLDLRSPRWRVLLCFKAPRTPRFCVRFRNATTFVDLTQNRINASPLVCGLPTFRFALCDYRFLYKACKHAQKGIVIDQIPSHYSSPSP